MSARSVEHFLEKDEALARLSAHAAHLQKVQQAFAQVVPVMLARSCRVANVRKEGVVVHAENGAVAAKLRQLVPTLLVALQATGMAVTQINIKVQPETSAPLPRPSPQAAVLGSGGRQSIARLMAELPEGALKSVLGRFLSRDKDS